MELIFENRIMGDSLFRLDDGSKKWYSDMTPKQKAEASKVLRAYQDRPYRETKSDFHDLRTGEPIQEGVILRRYPDGVETNVPHRVTHHSPSGFEWGNEGSGPADLALNILEAVLKKMHYHGPKVDCWRGQCFELAWTLHQDFKREFIVKIPIEGSVIYYPAIVAWIEDHAPAID
jgi:hypothetical protein